MYPWWWTGRWTSFVSWSFSDATAASPVRSGAAGQGRLWLTGHLSRAVLVSRRRWPSRRREAMAGARPPSSAGGTELPDHVLDKGACPGVGLVAAVGGALEHA